MIERENRKPRKILHIIPRPKENKNFPIVLHFAFYQEHDDIANHKGSVVPLAMF